MTVQLLAVALVLIVGGLLAYRSGHRAGALGLAHYFHLGRVHQERQTAAVLAAITDMTAVHHSAVTAIATPAPAVPVAAHVCNAVCRYDEDSACYLPIP